jgi:hypothetical protein
LIVHFPRVSFLFFSIGASARVHSLILFEYHADGQFSLFFFSSFLTSAKLPILWKDVSIYSISLFEWLKVASSFSFSPGVCI